MHTTEYLYGIKPIELEGLDYYSALQYKYNQGVKLYQELYLKENKTEDDNIRLFHVEKAVRHTKKLIDERDEHGIYHYHGDFKPKMHEYETAEVKPLRWWETVWQWLKWFFG